jgi:beta-xylosidase
MPLKLADIHIRDPFVLPVPRTREYFMFGTTNKIGQYGAVGTGFDCYQSKDLENWTGPFPAFRPSRTFPGKTDHWAAESHFYRGNYYLFGTVKARGGYRGTQIFISKKPQGPYVPLTKRPSTPPDWECLDGTLHIDVAGKPWMVFCHEWVQVHNGGMWAVQLSNNLKKTVGRPVFLFNASEAAWARPLELGSRKNEFHFPCYVTDGPFLYRTKKGSLLMLWSSFGTSGYTMSIARSTTGHVTGPWIQEKTPIWKKDGGHGMIFKTFDGRLMMTIHRPNNGPAERAQFFELEDTGTGLRLMCLDR